MKRNLLLILFALSACKQVDAQRIEKKAQNISAPILIDSVSTVFFPVLYDEELLSANKIAFFGGYYANILVYNSTKDEYKRLFQEDTYIEPFILNSSVYGSRFKNLTDNWIFYLIKDTDRNKNGRIDERDPSVLYASDKKGTGVKPLTKPDEHVVSMVVYEKQGFGLIGIEKFQEESNRKNRLLYFKKINLKTLEIGKAIKP